MDMEPTYFLYSGKLFHAAALEFLSKPRPASELQAEWESQPATPQADGPNPGGGADDDEVDDQALTVRDPFARWHYLPDTDHSDADSRDDRDVNESW